MFGANDQFAEKVAESLFAKLKPEIRLSLNDKARTRRAR
jgi:hypothetical protein